jgi:hypothetical protein
MRYFILIVFFSGLSHIGTAQISIRPNHIYVELLGTGGFGSIQYERQLFKKTRLNLHGGIGGYYDFETYISGILGVTYLVDTKWENRFLEFGFTMSSTPSETIYYSPDEITEGIMRYMPNAGFRWYTRNHWVWRVSVLAVMEKHDSDPWVGFSVGKNF